MRGLILISNPIFIIFQKVKRFLHSLKYSSLNFKYNFVRRILLVFKQFTGEYVTTCQLDDKKHAELLRTGNFGDGEDLFSGKVRTVPKDTNINILNNPDTKNND